MLQVELNAEVFTKPRLIFTVNGDSVANPVSLRVLNVLEGIDDTPGREFRVFADPNEVIEAFANGHSPDEAVVLFDNGFGDRQFAPTARGRSGIPIPIWARGTKWGVAIGNRVAQATRRVENCAEQIRADFGRRCSMKAGHELEFEDRLDKGEFPWGRPRRGEPGPTRVVLPSDITEVVQRLNDGPDMVEAISHMDFARQLPPGTKISWLRVPARPARYSAGKMEARLKAIAALERASTKLVKQNESVRDELMAGVVIHPDSPGMRECYLYPHHGDKEITHWSVRRPDMHVNGDELVASENDEMPGGFMDLVHVDNAYRINQGHWQWCFDWLCSEGPLLFVVSDHWSACYIDGTRWLVEHLRSMGREVMMVTSKGLDRVTVAGNGVYCDGVRVGTIWRQFPVFETRGKLADLVFASQHGLVRMVPEFAHFGNKTWFSLFRKHEKWFREELGEEQFAIIDRLLPHSSLVTFSEQDFPVVIGERLIASFGQLVDVDKATRDKLVLKVTGANDQAARSYGVFIGAARKQTEWMKWLMDRHERKEPFIIQERFNTSIESIGVKNLASGAAEVFRCRVLLRPWVVGDRLISSHTCCTPQDSTKVHGRVDMAIQPVEFI